MRIHPGYIFMQDGAPGHAAASTIQDLIERGISKVSWPPFSPDLNPIENVWNWMKEWIWDRYPFDTMSYDELRQTVREASYLRTSDTDHYSVGWDVKQAPCCAYILKSHLQ
jgi:hypothetical protein